MWNLAPTLGLSDVGLKKVCRRFLIPTPPLGYWAKKKFGKAPRKPPLPKYDDTGFEGIRFFPNAENTGPELPKATVSLIQKEKNKENRIIVPAELISPHPFVEATQRSLLAARKDDCGFVAPKAKRTLDIRVAPENIDRALRIMDTLLKACETRSLQIALQDEHGNRSTNISVLGERIKIALYEISERRERLPTTDEKAQIERYPSYYKDRLYYVHVPTGQLCLAITNNNAGSGQRRRWCDGSRRPLENLLNRFIESLYRTAEAIKVERAMIEERERQLKEAERQRREKAILRQQKLIEIQHEEDRVKGFLQIVDNWRRSHDIRDFLQAVREAFQNGTVNKTENTTEWLAWVEHLADRYDPLKKSPPSILDEKEQWTSEY